jgi:Zn-dependent M28 family amino/carboxypeptidase
VTTAFSSNIIANSTTGDVNSVVVVGAHLDSVIAGPGINDNGSGTAVVLAIALELSRLGLSPSNQIRFVFFGAEEHGLLGSKFYVKSLLGDDR